jgi:hypothetical protein
MQLTKRNPVGIGYWNRFIDQNGDVSLEEITQAEYEALSLSGAAQPSSSGKTWYGSFSGTKYDSPSGKILNGDYAVLDDTTCIVGITDGGIRFVAASSIVNDSIDDTLKTTLDSSTNSAVVYGL